nr:hypothetical protein CFP56_00650 [Quercus suber]
MGTRLRLHGPLMYDDGDDYRDEGDHEYMHVICAWLAIMGTSALARSCDHSCSAPSSRNTSQESAQADQTWTSMGMTARISSSAFLRYPPSAIFPLRQSFSSHQSKSCL